jgi:hypothetical protein
MSLISPRAVHFVRGANNDKRPYDMKAKTKFASRQCTCPLAIALAIFIGSQASVHVLADEGRGSRPNVIVILADARHLPHHPRSHRHRT